MPNVSLIRTKLYVRGQKPLSTILKQIQKGVFQHRVDALRKEVERGRPRVDFIQNQLPHFSPSARFQEYCQLEYLVKYTGIIRTDIAVKPEEAGKVRQLVRGVPYAYACFLNARGNALVILTKSSHEVIQHWSAGKAIADYYRRRLRRRKGVRAFGIADVCTFSFDPSAYFQPTAEVFPYQPAPNEKMLNITNIGTALKKKQA